MNIIYITAGAAGAYCGACARDVNLARALKALAHDVLLTPLYTPLQTDGPDPSVGDIFYGGVNACLQQQIPFFRQRLPFLDGLLDNPAFLKFVSRFAVSTKPKQLGAMTVSVLRGEYGYQKKELDKLVRFLGSQSSIDIINLGNSLLSGIAPALKKHFSAPVVCTLQGAETFVKSLLEPYCQQTVKLLRTLSKSIDAYIAPSKAYADEAAEFLDAPGHKFHVVPPGVEQRLYDNPGGRKTTPFTIGYLSKIARGKGFDILANAFVSLKDRLEGEFKLAVAGQVDSGSDEFWKAQCALIDKAGLLDSMKYQGVLNFNEKLSFLKNCSIFCMPSRVVEQRAMACLEAMAAGVPVIVPDRGFFREIIRKTNGGLLVKPDSPDALADAIVSLYESPAMADELGANAIDGIKRYYTSDKMARRTLIVYEQLIEAQYDGKLSK